MSSFLHTERHSTNYHNTLLINPFNVVIQIFFIVSRYIFVDFQLLKSYTHLILNESREVKMNQKTITYWLKAVIFAIGLLGLAFFGGATAYAFLFKPDYNELLPIYLRQNMVFIWITAAICYSILFFFNKIVKEIGNDNSFSMENVKNFKSMAVCGTLFIIEHVIQILIWLIKGETGLIQLSYDLLKIFVFIIFIILCVAMSKLVQHAYEIKQENELTI